MLRVYLYKHVTIFFFRRASTTSKRPDEAIRAVRVPSPNRARLLISHHCFLASPPVALPYRPGKMTVARHVAARMRTRAVQRRQWASDAIDQFPWAAASRFYYRREWVRLVVLTLLRSRRQTQTWTISLAPRCRIFILFTVRRRFSGWISESQKTDFGTSSARWFFAVRSHWQICKGRVEPGISNLSRAVTLVPGGQDARRERQRHGA